MTFKPLSNPILLISDNPSLPGGLSRMCRDLATLCCTLPQFRVAVLGRGTGNRRGFPFVLYSYPEYGQGQWGEQHIVQTWNDFSNGEDGIIMTLDDASRRHWFSNSTGLPDDLQKFLGPGRNFQKWGYFPIDSTGPRGDRLPLAAQDCINRYDRVLASSEWARDVMITGGRLDADWLPHGIWPDKFRQILSDHSLPKEVATAKGILGWEYSDVWVGCVMANQARKDYPAALECFAQLKSHYGNRFHAWLHTDEMIRYWNVYALAAEYGIGDCLEVTQNLSDDQLAIRYSACDCTILPSSGEGFGLPIAESLACGTACVVTDYAAGPSLVHELCRVRPICYRVDTAHNCLRAVIRGFDFATAAIGQIEAKRRDWEWQSEVLAGSVEHLHWPNLKHAWTRWLLEGLK